MNWFDGIRAHIEAKHLLQHSFYQRWSAGELTREELSEYAREYYHYTLAFPTFLSAVHSQSNDIALRQAVLENLIEEERGAENHPELWLRFCDALGLERDAVLTSTPSAATSELIDVMKTLCLEGESHEGLAALYAYESQVPAVAHTKIEGLKKFYGIDDAREISFFTTHLVADVLHAQTSEEWLDRLCDTSEKKQAATAAVEATLEALYGFLDGVNHQASVMVH